MNDNTAKMIVEWCGKLRNRIELEKASLMELVGKLKAIPAEDSCDKNEQLANAMLAYRHLEDAKMRIGKVIQATVGESIYDK